MGSDFGAVAGRLPSLAVDDPLTSDDKGEYFAYIPIYLLPKETEFRFNNRREDLYRQVLKMLQNDPSATKPIPGTASQVEDAVGQSAIGRAATYDVFISYSHSADLSMASVIERGLQKLAKPWYKRSALRVFRDESDLGATPTLWTEIAQAIDASGAFVLMASPQASRSRWVAQEIVRWRETHSMDGFFIVLTDGVLAWDGSKNDFDWESTDCLPPVLKGTFQEEPLFVDLRFVRGETTADLQNPQLRTAVARLAAPLHRLSPEELISEDVRLYHRAIRLAWSGVTTLVMLTIAAVLGGVLALQSSREAEREALSANARRLALQSFVSDQIEEKVDLGILLALQSIRLESNASAYRSLLLSLTALNNLQVILRAPGQQLYGVTFSADGNTVYAVADNSTVLAWHPAMPTPARYVNGFHTVSGLSIADSGPAVLASFEGGNIAIDRQSRVVARPVSGGIEISGIGGQSLVTISYDADDVEALALSPGAEVLATGSGSGLVTLWDTSTASPLGPALRPPDINGRVTALALGPGAKVLAAGYADQSVWIWNLETEIPEAQRVDAVYSEVNRLVFSPAGRRLLGAYGRSVTLWDLEDESSETLLGSSDVVQDVTFSPNGEQIAGATAEAVLIWRLKNHDAIYRSLQAPHQASVVSVATTADGGMARSLDYTGLVVTSPLGSEPTAFEELKVPTTAGARTAFSKDGSRLITLEDEGLVLMSWQLRQAEAVRQAQVTLPSQGIALAASKDASRVVVALAEGGLALYDIQPDAITPAWRMDTTDSIFTVALSDDGRWLAGAYEENGFFVRDLHGGREPVVRKGHDGTVTGLAFNRSATLLATAGFDQRVGRWRLPGVTLVVELRKAHDGRGHTVVAFNPATDQLISSGSDSLILLWPAPDREEEPLPFIGHIRPAYALAFSSDGQQLLAGDGNRQVFVWQVNPAFWRRHACSVVNRELTPDEWRLYVGQGTPEQICAVR